MKQVTNRRCGSQLGKEPGNSLKNSLTEIKLKSKQALTHTVSWPNSKKIKKNTTFVIKVDKVPEFRDQAREIDKQQMWHSALIKYGILK